MIDPKKLNLSNQIGDLRFATRQDYLSFFVENKLSKSIDEILDHKDYIKAIQQHWHSQGQNGCIFALLASRKRELNKWEQVVITDSIININEEIIYTLENKVKESILSSECEVLSILFPRIETEQHIAELLQKLLSSNTFILHKKEIIEDKVALQIRVPLYNNKKDLILSWVMIFSPISSFPNTRQGPITEISIRVKEKPDKQFYRLNKDKAEAHLADLPISYRDNVSERIWDNTLERTKLILGHKPNIFSAAKTTISINKEHESLFQY